MLRKCSIHGCEKEHYGKGFCRAHYKRNRRHGDPLAGRISTGDAQRFIDEVLKSETDECIKYPFYRNQSGYGWMRYNGKNLGSHVVVAMRHIGPKPSKLHEVCHTCGNGHNGCVNPRHLYWGTRRDNMKDALLHKTAACLRKKPTGENAYRAKYSDDQLLSARRRIENGEPIAKVSKDTGISNSTLYRLRSGVGRIV